MRRKNMRGWVGLVAVAVIGLAPALIGTIHADAATARRIPGNPLQIFQANGNGWSVAAANLNAGTQVTEGSDMGARNLTWTETGNYGGAPEGFLQFSNGNYMAATSDCVGVTIKGSSTSNGTRWALSSLGGGDYDAINPYCTNTFSDGSDWELGGLNSQGSQWVVNPDGAFGNYQKLAVT